MGSSRMVLLKATRKTVQLAVAAMRRIQTKEKDEEDTKNLVMSLRDRKRRDSSSPGRVPARFASGCSMGLCPPARAMSPTGVMTPMVAAMTPMAAATPREAISPRNLREATSPKSP
jgi:hypothetical protein